MLLRLAYLGVTNAFAMLHLLPMGDRDKTVEILALRHQIMTLERQLREERVRFTPSDRAFLAAQLHGSPGTCSAECGCWCVRTRYCAGTTTFSPAAILPPPDPGARDGLGPRTPCPDTAYLRRTTSAGPRHRSRHRSRPRNAEVSNPAQPDPAEKLWLIPRHEAEEIVRGAVG